MGRRLRVTAIPKNDPDIGLYVLALIELARQLQAEEEARHQAAAQSPEGGEATHA